MARIFLFMDPVAGDNDTQHADAQRADTPQHDDTEHDDTKHIDTAHDDTNGEIIVAHKPLIPPDMVMPSADAHSADTDPLDDSNPKRSPESSVAEDEDEEENEHTPETNAEIAALKSPNISSQEHLRARQMKKSGRRVVSRGTLRGMHHDPAARAWLTNLQG